MALEQLKQIKGLLEGSAEAGKLRLDKKDRRNNKKNIRKFCNKIINKIVGRETPRIGRSYPLQVLDDRSTRGVSLFRPRGGGCGGSLRGGPCGGVLGGVLGGGPRGARFLKKKKKELEREVHGSE